MNMEIMKNQVGGGYRHYIYNTKSYISVVYINLIRIG